MQELEKNELEFLRYFYKEILKGFGEKSAEICDDIEQEFCNETRMKLPAFYQKRKEVIKHNLELEKLAEKESDEWDSYAELPINHMLVWQCIRFYRREDTPSILKMYLLLIAKNLNELKNENEFLKKN
jgi:hypothetical protein